MKKIALYFAFLSLILPVFVVHAREPLASELRNTYINLTGTNAITQGLATGTNPYFIYGINFVNNEGSAMQVYCGNSQFQGFMQPSTVADSFASLYFDPPVRCEGAIKAKSAVSGGNANAPQTVSIYAYEMSDTDFDTQSSGGGGGGIATDTFDIFYLFFGMVLLMWALSLYIWYFKPIKT